MGRDGEEERREDGMEEGGRGSVGREGRGWDVIGRGLTVEMASKTQSTKPVSTKTRRWIANYFTYHCYSVTSLKNRNNVYMSRKSWIFVATGYSFLLLWARVQVPSG